MSSKKEAWGIEVGAQAIKAMKLGRTGGGVTLLDFECMPFKKVLTTPDLNVEEAIRVNLDALATKHEFDKSTVVVSVPGHMAFARFAKLPPIESSKVKSIVAYEAQQQIPFPIDEVEWDYQVFAQEDAPDIEVGIFAITKERVANFLSNYRAVGLRVDLLTLSPVAVYNAFANENASGTGHGSGTVYLDIGTTSTDIIVVEDETIWLRTLPLGGNHFTQALMKQFKISFAKAEKLKLEAATSKYAKQIYQAMRGVFNDLVTEIERSLGFYTSLNRDAELTQIVGVGSTWKLPGLQKYIKQNTRMEVIRPDGFAQLEVEDRRAAEFSSVAVNMATAYGLALQGLGLGVVDANVLPQTVLKQRMWKAKQPWIIAAAACIAGAAALGPITQFLESQSFNGAWNAVSDDITATITQAQADKDTYDTVQTTDPRPGIRNYRRSFDYANLYPGLYADVTTAMATIQPHEAFRDLDWDNPQAVKRASEVPRSERDQVWVTSITTEYKPPAVVAPSINPDTGLPAQQEGVGGQPAPPPASGGGFADTSGDAGGVSLRPIPFPQPRASSSAPVPTEAGAPGDEPAAADPLEGIADSPAPRIIVTVSGETTMNGAEMSSVLNQRVVEWMNRNAVRPDRPYIIVPELIDPRFSQRPVTNQAVAGGGFGTANVRSELSPTPKPEDNSTPPAAVIPGGFAQPGGGFGVPGGGGNEIETREVKTPEGWYATLGSASTGFSLDALYPKRLLSNEKRSGDFNFTFTFEVVLLSPDEARKSILTAAPPPDTPAQDVDPAPESDDQTPTAANASQEDQA